MSDPTESNDQVPDYSVEPVPKVPHRMGWRWAMSDIIRIIFLGGLLAMIIVARQPCSDSVATFVDSFEEPDAGMKLERLTPEQIQERFGGNDDSAVDAVAADGGKDGTSETAGGADVAVEE